ncbi:MAG: hypothetical protein AAFO81_03605 [Pseudomonadota bacterium]
MYELISSWWGAAYFAIAFAAFCWVTRHKFHRPMPVRIIGTLAMVIPPVGLFLMFALAMKAPITGQVTGS